MVSTSLVEEGTQESRGTRDEVYVRPVLRYLLDREKAIEPTKVTLQVSSKGLKIVQNVARPGSRVLKADQVKHLIPPHAVTYVMPAEPGHEDIVCCILLIYNPVTKCPIHVHAYRCDSVETAWSLRNQLKQLVDQRQKLDPPELFPKVLTENEFCSPIYPRRRVQTPCVHSSAHGNNQKLVGSDGRSTRTDEENPDFEADVEDVEKSACEGHTSIHTAVALPYICRSEKFSPHFLPVDVRDTQQENSPQFCDVVGETRLQNPQLVRLYDSLAQELKEKLAGKGYAKCRDQKPPLLLPPKDYDTVCRKQGNLVGIDFRRSTNQNIIGNPGTSQDPAYQAESGSAETGEISNVNLASSEQQKPVHSPARANPVHNRSGKSSTGIGSDELVKEASRAQMKPDMSTESSYDEWNYRPANCREMDAKGQFKSMDFLQNRLDHFHVEDRIIKRTLSPERSNTGPNVTSRECRAPFMGSESKTYFGQLSKPPRLLNNERLSLTSFSPCRYTGLKTSEVSPPTLASDDKNKSLSMNNKNSGSHERPVSFPMGVISVKRDIPWSHNHSRFGFHQHPIKESMIAAVTDHHRPLSPRMRAPIEKSLPLLSVSKSGTTKDTIEPKSENFSRRFLTPSSLMKSTNLDSGKPEPLRPDLRRQSLAEFEDRSPVSNVRNPLTKYFASPFERRKYGNRYSVAESNEFRLY